VFGPRHFKETGQICWNDSSYFPTQLLFLKYCDVLAVGNRATVECDAANNMADALAAVEQ
jgi:hypothetical protein